MNQLFHQVGQDDDIEVVIISDTPLEEIQKATILKVTSEGVILDFYIDGDLVGTIGMTYDEWFEMSQRGFLINRELEENE